jgi:RNA polymerase sigma-70 factor (ECF subfamily)
VGFWASGRHRSDTELLAAHVAGDRHAFAELFRRHHRQLYRLARQSSLSREDADAAVGTWLHRIVRNACLDRLRRAQARPTVPFQDVHPVSDRTCQVETAIVVRRALLRLPIQQRAAVVAVDLQGYSIAETARRLGVPEGTVKSRCARGRARLANLLGYPEMIGAT